VKILVHFHGEYEIKAPKGTLWKLLNNPGEVSKCIPGVETVEIIDKNNFKATVKLGIGFIKQRFNFHFAFVNVDAPKHVELKGEGLSSDNKVDFSSALDLQELDQTRTKLAWSADVQFLGPLSGMASRFMQNAASDTTKKLFACLKDKVEPSLDQSTSGA
jgi:carbon monoxide dehydrogenase subunit G